MPTRTGHSRVMKLTRELGVFDAVMILMGIVLGSGIFLVPGLMAEFLPSPGWIMVVWLTGGLFTLAGAFAWAELGAAYPRAGGQYVFLREAYGPLTGFLFGWMAFLVYMTGGIAALAIGGVHYLQALLPGVDLGAAGVTIPLPLIRRGAWVITRGQWIAVFVIGLLSWVHYRGLILGKQVQNSLTVLKILLFAGFIIIGLIKAPPGFSPKWELPPGGSSFFTSFGLALVAVFWAFDGWNNVAFAAGEIRSPQKQLPRALIIGTLAVTVLYLLMNRVYFSVIPVEEAGTVLIAEKTAARLLGAGAAPWVSLVIFISILGSINGSVLVGPRIYYAMALDGLFFQKAAWVHPRFGTPARAILWQGVWSSVLVLSGTFEQLITFAMFVSVLFWIGGAAAVFTLRKRHPDLERPYKTWGYPVVPLLFITGSVLVLANTLMEKPWESLAGLGLALMGIPVYFYWRNRHRVMINKGE